MHLYVCCFSVLMFINFQFTNLQQYGKLKPSRCCGRSIFVRLRISYVDTRTYLCIVIADPTFAYTISILMKYNLNKVLPLNNSICFPSRGKFLNCNASHTILQQPTKLYSTLIVMALGCKNSLVDVQIHPLRF